MSVPQKTSPSTSFALPLHDPDLQHLGLCFGSSAAASDHADAREHAAVFSAQHLKGFIRGNTIWTRTPTDPVQACKGPGGAFSKQSILRNPARTAERECSAGHFLTRRGAHGTMRLLLILVAICFSATAFAQTAAPKVGWGTKIWAGDCVGVELLKGTHTSPEQGTSVIPPDQNE